MAKIGKITQGIPAWQRFDPSKAKLTKNQKEALKRKDLRALCDEVVKREKFNYAFYQVNRYGVDEFVGKHVVHEPQVRAISRFSTKV